MRALVIDDSRAIRLILGQILKALKIEVNLIGGKYSTKIQITHLFAITYNHPNF